MGNRRWFLIRHGATIGDSDLRFHGISDIPLSTEGEDQMNALSLMLEGIKPQGIIHSPLSRSRQSAEILKKRLGWETPLLEMKGLTEIDFGKCEGLTEQEIKEKFPDFYNDWKVKKNYESFPGGEKLEEFKERVYSVVEELLFKFPEGDLIIVAHKGVLRRILWALVGEEDEEIKTFNPPLGSLSMVEEENSGRWVLIFKERLP